MWPPSPLGHVTGGQQNSPPCSALLLQSDIGVFLSRGEGRATPSYECPDETEPAEARATV